MEKKFKISLQFSMLSIFLSLFIVTMLTIITITTVRLYDSMIVISDQQMSQVSELVNDQLTFHIRPAELSSTLTLQLIRNNILDPNNTEQILNYTVELLDSLKDTAMVYWGDSNGNFIISRLEGDGSLSSEIIKRNEGEATSTHISRDKDKNVTAKKVTTDVTYDPRQRPWYKAAKEAEKPTWSKPYIFFTGENKVLGVTSAAPLYNQEGALQGVVGIDVKLDIISQFLATQHIGHSGVAFIIDDVGQLIAHPKLNKLADREQGYKILPISALNDKHLTKAFVEYKNHKKEKFTFEHNGANYLAEFRSIPSFQDKNWSIAVVVPEDDFIGPLKKTNMITLTLSGFILLIGVMLITLFSKKIAASVNKLVKQTEEIKNFDLTSTETIYSYIKEISFLASGIASMRGGLRAFQKYVPADLVRRLIREHEDATLGGKRKKITIMFTDIDGFTEISESMTAEHLTRHISTYFEHLSRIINQQRGTIDKYIGDAIMAFWGSPTKDKNQVCNACKTALTIQSRLKLLNNQWKQENKPQLPTRIGIHTGDAIVGNLGSSERLNYTAIGDTINAASRLENINKSYQSRIIVSEAVYEEAKDHFFFKLLDHITVKGKTKTTKIFELIAEKTEANTASITAYCELYDVAFSLYQQQQWEQAIKVYQEISQEYPEDTSAVVMMNRCAALKQEPPDEDWDGIWRYKEKL